MKNYIDTILGITMISTFLLAFICLIGWVVIDLIMQFKQVFV